MPLRHRVRPRRPGMRRRRVQARPLLAFLGIVSATGMACPGNESGLPEGTWTLEGASAPTGAVQGRLDVTGRGITVRLHDGTWGTGTEPVPGTVEEAGAAGTWLHFPLQTALGDATAALLLEPGFAGAVLPLGARPGELELTLTLQEGAPDAETLGEAAERAAEGIAEQRAAWRRGAFRIVSPGDRLVGLLRFPQEGPVQVELLSPSMITDGPVPALRRDEGPDIVLTFPVEPSHRGEPGELRVNVPTGRVVLPAADTPTPLDRWMKLEPGLPSPEERNARRKSAWEVTVDQEKALVERVGRNAATEATHLLRQDPDRGCPDPSALGAPLQEVLSDYDVEIHEADPGGDTPGASGRCVIHLRPREVQHTRRIEARIDPGGILELEVLGSPP